MSSEDLQKELEKEKTARLAAEKRIAGLEQQIAILNAVPEQINKHNLSVVNDNTRLTQLIACLHNGILVVDENKKIVIVNDAFCNSFNLDTTPQELIGRERKVVDKDLRKLFKNPDQYDTIIKDVIKTREPLLNEDLELITGSIFSFDYIPLFSSGLYKGYLWKFTNITRNKTIETTFESQRNFYEQILNNTPADIIVCTSDYRYLYLNPSAVNDPGLRKWMIGKTVEDFYNITNRPVEEAKNRRAFLNSVNKAKTVLEREEKFTDSDGNIRYHLRKMFPVLDNQGEVEMIIGYGVDITERKKIEEQIYLSEKRYREIFNYSQAWICTHDMNGCLLSVNPSACKILGYPENDLIGLPIEQLIPEHHRIEFSQVYLNKIISQGKAEGIMNILNKEGKSSYILYQNYLVNESDNEPYVIGFAQNITGRIIAEEALKRSEEKYRSIIENMNLGLIEIDLDERIIFANQRFCTMSGYNLEELTNKKATDLFLQGASLKKTRHQLINRGYALNSSYELAIRTKSGEDRWWLTSATPVSENEGLVKGTIGIHLDITEQKRLAEQLKESKQKTDRLSRSKDIFLTNMSHEIRTPLNAIMGLGKLLGKDELTLQQKKFLAGIESASAGLLAIINDLLDLSKIESGKITIESISFNLEMIINQAIDILTYKAEEKGLKIAAKTDNKIAPVLMGDPYRVNQVFMNILSNAIKFTEKGSVSLEAVLQEKEPGKQYVQVKIQDTGIGIKPEYLDKLFDKFTQEDETVVRKFGGTGLGMNITRQLMKLMGGSIEVTSEKNKGTTVILNFYFGVGSSRVIEKKNTIRNDTSQIMDKKVLLVEDNNLNRLLANTILTGYGALVTEAENGAEAIELMSKNDYDIVLMDIQMPVMDGIEATRIIRMKINATVPVLALTANTVRGKEEQYLAWGMNDIIVKPYTEVNLVNPVAKWLNKKAPVMPVDRSIKTERSMDHSKPEKQTKTKTKTETTKPTIMPATNVNINIPEGRLYDIGKLLNIANNDNTFINKMMMLFISETTGGLAKINEGYNNGDLKTVKYYAHRMKPSISNLNISILKDDILEIEFMEQKSEALSVKIEKLNKVLETVINQIRSDYKL